MTTNFPNTLDNNSTLPVETANTKLAVNHINAHRNSSDAIIALETKVGVNNSTDPSSLEYKINNDVVHKTGNETMGGMKTVTGEINGNLKLNTPQGHMLNGKIVTSVASGNLTVAIKTLAGNDPSASDPVYVRIGNTIKTLNTARQVVMGTSYNWLNLASTELINQEVDLFVYLWNDTVDNSVGMLVSRIPYARVCNDFTNSDSAEKGIAKNIFATITGTDEVENVGRINAIYNTNWSIPATSVIINRPIFETRRLNYNAQWSSSGTQPAIGNGSISAAYQVVMNRINVYVKQNMGSTTTYGTGNYQWSLPFVYYTNVNLIQLQAGSGAFYNGYSFPIIPHNNYYFGGSGVSWTSSKELISGGVCSKDNPVTWEEGYYFGFGWQYDI